MSYALFVMIHPVVPQPGVLPVPHRPPVSHDHEDFSVLRRIKVFVIMKIPPGEPERGASTTSGGPATPRYHIILEHLRNTGNQPHDGINRSNFRIAELITRP